MKKTTTYIIQLPNQNLSGISSIETFVNLQEWHGIIIYVY